MAKHVVSWGQWAQEEQRFFRCLFIYEFKQLCICSRLFQWILDHQHISTYYRILTFNMFHFAETRQIPHSTLASAQFLVGISPCNCLHSSSTRNLILNRWTAPEFQRTCDFHQISTGHLHSTSSYGAHAVVASCHQHWHSSAWFAWRAHCWAPECPWLECSIPGLTEI